MTTPAGPTAAFTWSPTEPNVENVVSFSNSSSASSGSFSSQWYISDSIFSTVNASYIYFIEGEYPVSLVVTDDLTGCVDSLTELITIFGEMTIPNVITMNNDQVNDEFFIKGLKENSYLVILNRWGNVVFETNNYLNDWKGVDIISGNPVLEGVYTYLIQSPDGKQKHGFIHVTY
jgi:gliding motility-associated-like protein